MDDRLRGGEHEWVLGSTQPIVQVEGPSQRDRSEALQIRRLTDQSVLG
jgi:hypothetical protein